MTTLASAFVTIRPDMAGFGARLTKSTSLEAGKAGESAGKHMSSRFASALKLGSVLAGAFAALKVGDFVGDSVKEARESQKVGALTTSVIKATGGAAKVTAKQVGDLATALSNKTGIDDETIQSGQNMLLTFKNIRNEAGKGNDIFNQTSKTLVDLASAMGTDPKKAAIQLGKALNDPIKGISALSRVGVTFDDGQKKQIKTLVAHGKTMQAQKIILHELNSEFGGAAEAQATAGEKLATSFANFKEQIGTALLPVIDKVEGVLTGKVIPAMSTFFTQIQNGTGPGGRLVTVVRGLFDSFGKLSPIINLVKGAISGGGGIGGEFEKTGKSLAAFGRAVLPPIREFAHNLVDVLGPGVRSIGKQIATEFLPAFRNILPILAPVAKFLLSMFGDALIGAVKGAIQVIHGVISVISGVFNLVSDLIHGRWKKLWGDFKQILTGVLDIIIGAVKVWFNVGILSIFRHGAIALLKSWRGLGDGLKTIGKKALDAVKGIFDRALSGVGRIIGTAIRNYFGLWRRLFTFYRDVAVHGWQVLRSAFGGAVAAIRTVISRFIDGALGIWRGLFRRIQSIASDGMDLARRGVRTVLTKIRGAFGDAVDAIGRIWSKLREKAAAPVRFVVNTVYNEGIRRVVNAIPGVKNLPTLKFARGGEVPMWAGTPGKDSVPAMLMPGEHVWTAKEVAKAGGHGAVKAMRDAVQHFARGGAVWPTVGRRTSSYAGHDGVDINQPPGPDFGAPIFAWRTGKITYAGWNRGYGHAIFEKAPGYPEVVYGHGSSVFVHSGQHVKAGQRIGRVGATGHASGPHLHFGHPGGTYGQAMALLAGAGTAPSGISGGSYGGGGGGGGSHLVSAYDGPSLGSVLKSLKPSAWKARLNKMGEWGHMLTGAVGSMASSVKHFATAKIHAAIKAAGKVVKAVAGYTGAGPSAGGPIKTQARIMLRQQGWGNQWPSLNQLVSHESGWNPRAQNPTSTAYGLFQFLNGTWGSVGARKTSDPHAQLAAGMKYIRRNYHDPNGAWRFWQNHHWYDQGGMLPHGGFASNTSGKPERILTPRQTQSFDNLVAVLERGGVGAGSAPLIGHATIEHQVDLERYERQRAFRERMTNVGG